MLENWLSAVPESLTAPQKLKQWQLGSGLRVHTGEGFPDLTGIHAAIVGIGEADANAVREHLYPLTYPQGKFPVADLGNFRKDNLAFIIPVLTELLNNRIVPVLIANDWYFALSLFKAAEQSLPLINLVTIDEALRFGSKGADTSEDNRSVLQQVIHETTPATLFHLGIIGYQSHYADPAVLHLMQERNFDGIRLGQARNNLPEIEPIVRDGDLCWFNLTALKQSEAPGQEAPTPGGFTMEESCQICRYAGMSDKLKAFGIFGFRAEYDQRAQTAQTTAQMLWYFLEGLQQRKGDFPASAEGLTEYIVEFPGQDRPITFWKSRKSGRWWVQVSVHDSRQEGQRHRLIPCSHSDYLATCQNEIPERILNAFRRFE
jgi:formiminoglutamase